MSNLDATSRRVISAKIVLLAAAPGAQWALDSLTPHATVIVAAGLVVSTLLAGPPLHHSFVLPPKNSPDVMIMMA